MKCPICEYNAVYYDDIIEMWKCMDCDYVWSFVELSSHEVIDK